MWGRHDPNVEYDGVVFARASCASRQLRRQAPRQDRLRYAVRDPVGLFAIVQVLIKTPRLRVTPSDGPAGRALRDHLRHREHLIPVNRVAQGVLPLPATTALYLRGRSRQALRTNLHRAQELQIECLALEPADRGPIIDRWIELRFPDGDSPHTADAWLTGSPPSAQWIAAVDPGGEPLAIAILSVDVEWALLHSLVSRTHLAHWFLHAQVVDHAIRSGAGYMCVDSENALLLREGLQYFQRRTGYQVAHLRMS